MTSYKNITQKYLDELFEFEDDSEKYSDDYCQNLLHQLNQSIESHNIDSLETVYDYYLKHDCENSANLLCQSEIPIKLCSIISDPEKVKIFYNSQDKYKKEFVMALYLINKAINTEPIHGITIEILDSFFNIYQSDTKKASDLSISIFQHLLFHPEIMDKIADNQSEEEDDEIVDISYYQEIILDKIQNPHSILSRILSIYALISCLQFNDFETNSYNIGIVCHVFKNSGNCRLLLATLQLLDSYLNLYQGSEESLDEANKLDLFQIVMDGIMTSAYEDNEMLLALRKTSSNLLIKIIRSGHLEFNHEIAEKQIIQQIGILLEHVEIQCDIDCGVTILLCLLDIAINPVQESDKIFHLDYIIPQILDYQIIDKMVNCLTGITFDINIKIFKIFSMLILIKCEAALQAILENEMCAEMISLLDTNASDSLVILQAVQFLIQNVDNWEEYIDVSELSEVLFKLRENEDVTPIAQSIIEMLSLE